MDETQIEDQEGMDKGSYRCGCKDQEASSFRNNG
jgi:hypothetical protein